MIKSRDKLLVQDLPRADVLKDVSDRLSKFGRKKGFPTVAYYLLPATYRSQQFSMPMEAQKRFSSRLNEPHVAFHEAAGSRSIRRSIVGRVGHTTRRGFSCFIGAEKMLKAVLLLVAVPCYFLPLIDNLLTMAREDSPDLFF
jgi:hypothetical protein